MGLSNYVIFRYDVHKRGQFSSETLHKKTYFPLTKRSNIVYFLFEIVHNSELYLESKGCVNNLPYCWPISFDELVKSRHSGENRSPGPS